MRLTLECGGKPSSCIPYGPKNVLLKRSLTWRPCGDGGVCCFLRFVDQDRDDERIAGT